MRRTYCPGVCTKPCRYLLSGLVYVHEVYTGTEWGVLTIQEYVLNQVLKTKRDGQLSSTVELPNKGHFRTACFVLCKKRLSSLEGSKCIKTTGREYCGTSSCVLR